MWQCVFLSHFVAAHQPQSPQCSNSNDAAAASLWRCIWNLNLGQWTLLDPKHLRSSSWNPLRLTCSNWLVYFPFKILEHGFGWQALRMTSLMWATMARRFFSIENVPGRCWRGVCCLKNGNPHTIRQLLFSNCCYFPKSCMFDPPSRNASGNFKNNTPKTPNINTNSKKLCNWATAITELWWAIGLGYITLKMRHKVVLDCLSHAHVNRLQLRLLTAPEHIRWLQIKVQDPCMLVQDHQCKLKLPNDCRHSVPLKPLTWLQAPCQGQATKRQRHPWKWLPLAIRSQQFREPFPIAIFQLLQGLV